MKVFKTVEEMRAFRTESEGKCGFVPTMGALHEGHAELIARSVSECKTTIVSIFVNPTQFGAGEDFEKYPRTLEKDLEICEKAGVNAVFVPDKSMIYGNLKQLISFKVEEEFSSILCGKTRPDHFKGVVQVVAILFNIVQPNTAFFGEKDYQQLTIIKRMVMELHFPVKIKAVPTVREIDGLAKSSRNRYLSQKERDMAANIYKVMEFAKQKAESARFDRLAIPVEFVEEEVKRKLESMIDNIKIDYVEIRNSLDLSKSRFLVKDSRIFIAAYIGATRLIDNLFIGE